MDNHNLANLANKASIEDSKNSNTSMHGKKGFSPLVSFAFTVNYIVSAGSLAIPLAFHEAGVSLGVITLVSYLYHTYI